MVEPYCPFISIVELTRSISPIGINFRNINTIIAIVKLVQADVINPAPITFKLFAEIVIIAHQDLFGYVVIGPSERL